MTLGVLRGIYRGVTDAYETNASGIAYDPNELILPEGGERLPRPVSPDEVDDFIWMLTAKRLMGTEEYSEGDNQDILQWARDLGGSVAKDYKHDSIAWCGLFVAYCFFANGIDPVKDPLWALNWAKWQTHVDPGYGSLLVFKRSGGGHVGYYISEDSYSYHVLGGNQSDEVNVSKVSKAQLVSSRWPTAYIDSYKHKVIRKTFDGKLLTPGQMA
jgi:uncharacterized protein (TIGR02594 family)